MKEQQQIQKQARKLVQIYLKKKKKKMSEIKRMNYEEKSFLKRKNLDIWMSIDLI